MSQKNLQSNNTDTIDGKIAIIAGEGNLPDLIADAFTSSQMNDFIFVKIINDDNALGFDKGKQETNKNTYRVKLGEIGKTLKVLKDNEVSNIVFAGYFKRPHRLLDLKLDFTGVKWATKLAMKGNLSDDKLLRELSSMMEGEGFRVISPKSILEKSKNIAEKKNYTKASPTKDDLKDIERGREILESLSKHDIAQAIIVENNMVLGIEAVEGTDELIKRVATYSLHKPGCGTLIKMAKTTQDQRMDLPTIGKKTIENLIKSQLKGIAIESNKTIFMDKDEVIKIANQNNIFIVGV